MQISELDFPYPERLIATERRLPTRVLLARGSEFSELAGGIRELLEEFQAGDLLVINETRVLKRRLFAESELEILFLSSSDDRVIWQVLCPSSRWKDGTKQTLAEGVELELIERGRVQSVRASRPLDEAFFARHGEMPLPPYIQKARADRRNRAADTAEYQTAWAQADGSLAAPTASLHFSNADLATLEARGVKIARIVLHVGLGTFLPIQVDTLDEHVMHAEEVEIPPEAWNEINAARGRGGKIWALGTTVARSLESAAHDKLARGFLGGFRGSTDLFIRPGHEWRVVDRLLTNFHQPRSTLVALVASFGDLATLKRAYAWAIEREFRLFSYGDLTAWIR